MLAALCGLAVLIAAGIAWRELHAWIAGAEPVAATDLARDVDGDRLGDYIAVRGAAYVDLGVEAVTRTKALGITVDTEHDASYGGLVVGDRVLVVYDPDAIAADHSARELHGMLVPLTYEEERTLRPDPRRLPYKLDVRPLWRRAQTPLIVGVLALALAVVALWRSRRRPRAASRIIQQLARFRAPEDLAAQVDAQVPATTHLRTKEVLVTADFALWPGSGVVIVPLRELVWVYWARAEKSPGTLVFQVRTGFGFELDDVTPAQAQASIAKLEAAAPWITTGYDPQYARMWVAARANVVAAADARRAHAGTSSEPA